MQINVPFVKMMMCVNFYLQFESDADSESFVSSLFSDLGSPSQLSAPTTPVSSVFSPRTESISLCHDSPISPVSSNVSDLNRLSTPTSCLSDVDRHIPVSNPSQRVLACS